ncbi:hypothetical protein GGR53DRAFT_246802 [Hypoxylon sp. FL1150]|nr:hypothetical protein GGR53DRAFT_246802 [Hypoxylon sp. FL1150]
MATRPPCMVCKTVEGKYKCPHCYLYSCSLSCSKEHHNSHPPVEAESADVKSESMNSAGTSDVPTALTSDTSQEGNTEPDVSKRSGIADMPEYKALLRRYPNLERLLWDIAVATDPPIRDGGVHGQHSALSGVMKNGGKANESWTKDMGYENGVHVLRQTRDNPGDDRDALKEYCELVRQYSAKREALAAANTQREFAQDNARAINNLLRAEKSNMS